MIACDTAMFTKLQPEVSDAGQQIFNYSSNWRSSVGIGCLGRCHVFASTTIVYLGIVSDNVHALDMEGSQ
ncbi:hypothetical protein D3C81_2084960 [compost metagenome]